MKRSDRIILSIIPLIALIAAFWLLILAPKQDEASKLGGEVSNLRAKVERDKQLASDAATAKQTFADTYRHVITLGKAVPADDDTSALFAQLGVVAHKAGVQFRAIDLDTSAATSVPAATTPPATAPPASTPSGASAAAANNAGGGSSSPGPTSPVTGTAANQALSAAAGTTAGGTATEANAAALPIGAGIGAAGFPVMPYKLEFRGGFSAVANFVQQLDGLVKAHNGHVAATGRLVTIDGFTLSGSQARPFPTLSATFSVTTYLLPAGQGLTAGATPSGPAPGPASTGAPASAPPAPASIPTPATTNGSSGQ